MKLICPSWHADRPAASLLTPLCRCFPGRYPIVSVRVGDCMVLYGMSAHILYGLDRCRARHSMTFHTQIHTCTGMYVHEHVASSRGTGKVRSIGITHIKHGPKPHAPVLVQASARKACANGRGGSSVARSRGAPAQAPNPPARGRPAARARARRTVGRGGAGAARHCTARFVRNIVSN